jgi:hypothetical protein
MLPHLVDPMCRPFIKFIIIIVNIIIIIIIIIIINILSLLVILQFVMDAVLIHMLVEYFTIYGSFVGLA